MTDELTIHLCTGCGGETLARGLCLDCVADVAAGRPAGTFTAAERAPDRVREQAAESDGGRGA